ncbi:hypothetical protein LSAT2_031775, partial [Lamellibrachia satsuma]
MLCSVIRTGGNFQKLGLWHLMLDAMHPLTLLFVIDSSSSAKWEWGAFEDNDDLCRVGGLCMCPQSSLALAEHWRAI